MQTEAKLRERYSELKQTRGFEHPGTLKFASDLARSLCIDEKYDEAEVVQREMLAMQVQQLGAKHPDTLAMARNLAGSLWNQGRDQEAQLVQHTVLFVQQTPPPAASSWLMFEMHSQTDVRKWTVTSVLSVHKRA